MVVMSALSPGNPVPGESAAPRQPDLSELLRASARGDDKAFADLYDATSRRLYGLVVRVVRDPAQAEEVAQEAFLEIWRTSARFDPARGSAMSWMMTIAHRKAVDRVRSAEAASRRDQTYEATTQERAYDITAEEVERSLEGQRVRNALESLTETQRGAVQLAYFGGYTHNEVAALLGIPLGTAKTRIRDGLIRLRDTLGMQS
jgi:RNA polymerase sigma-70 factor, ECF subfamily